MDFMLLNLPWLDIVSKFILIVVIVCVIALLITVIVLYFLDRIQTTHAIRRNYPVIGRFRYWFEHLGQFFRQYFFALDREELPFNRAQRSWVYRAAKNVDNTVAFGSTYNLKIPGAVIFSNCSFPSLQRDVSPHGNITIGEDCQHPYTTSQFFHISGMSYGAISKPAVQALSRGAHKAQCWLNTGEGGLSPYHLEGNCDIVFQIGTAKYGVRDEKGQLSEDKLKKIAAHDAVKMFELKLSQGAKPGKGGILPAIKVSEEIAEIRGIPADQASLSPNRHEDIKTIPQLLDQVEKIRRVTGKPTGFKTVLGDERWLREFCQEVNKRGPSSAPDFITIDSADGGTGAAPASLIDYMGLPISESLPIAVDTLLEYGLKERVKVIASGKLINPSEVAWALCMGADFVTSARGFMFALGCIQALQCNKNTCPTGITTHDKKLQRGLVTKNKAERVAKYALNMEKEVGIIAHSCGADCAGKLRREHARIIMQSGQSKSLEDIYPYPDSSQ